MVVPPPPVTQSPRNRDRIEYQTEYACEGMTLNIACKENYVIHLVRANYGRLSVSICNPQAKIDMSVNCMSWKSHLIMEKRCMNKQSCSVQVSAKNFDDPCPGTIKYLEVQYNCTLASLASSTTTTTTTTTAQPVIRNSSEEDVVSTSPTTTSTTTTSMPPTAEITAVQTTTASIPPTPRFAQEPMLPPERPAPFPTEDNPDSDYVDTTKSLSCVPTTARNLYWNWTRAGKAYVQKCPGGASGLARWHCDPNEVHWIPEKPDLKQCKSLWVENLSEKLAKQDLTLTLTQLASDLSHQTYSKELFSADVREISNIIQVMLTRLEPSVLDQNIGVWHQEQLYKDLLQDFVGTVSNLLEVKNQEAWSDLSTTDQKQILTRLMTALEENAGLLSNTFKQENNYPVVKNNVLMSVRGVDSWRSMVIHFPSINEREQDQNWSSMQDSVNVPVEAIQQFFKQGTFRKLIFIVYNNLDIYLVPEPENHFPRSAFDERLASGFINSRVVSVSVGKESSERLAQPIQVTLKHLQEEIVSEPQCVYWNIESSAWSPEGCWVSASNRSSTVCACDHLGSFAIMMENPSQVDRRKPFDQRLVVTVGCCVALGFCCIAALLLFLLKLHKNDQLWIHRNLAVNLMIAEFVFVVGINQTHLGVTCSAVAALLQYFLLVALGWTFFEGFHLYSSLVEPMEIHKSKLRCYASLSYIAPAIVTGVSLLIDPSSFGTPKYCWLRSDNFFIFSFIAPMVGIIFGCVVFVCIGVCIICNQGGLATTVKGKEEDKVNTVKTYMYWVTFLLVFMTFTWASAVVYVAKFNLAWAVIFATFNSVLGVFLLIFTCWKNEAFQDRYGHSLQNSRWIPACMKRCLFGGRNQLAIDVSVNNVNGAPLHPHPSWNTDHKAVSGLTAQCLGPFQSQQQHTLVTQGKFTIPVRPSMGGAGPDSGGILALTPQTINISGTVNGATLGDRARSMAMANSLSKSQHNLVQGSGKLGQPQGQWVQWRGARPSPGGPYSEASSVYSAFADHIYESIDVGSMVPPPAPADSTPNILYGNTAEILQDATGCYEQRPLINKYSTMSNQLDATLSRMSPAERAATARRAKQIAASTPVVQVNGQLFTPQQLYEVALTQALQVSAKIEEQDRHQDNQVIAVLDGEKVVTRINPLDSPTNSSNSSATSEGSPSSAQSCQQPPRYNLSTYC
ncbi:latrophilin Cirl [Galendromus occidentalis]|uniref:Latrophilin Cirl n=1 Tax=Galendromus occidentalis TaxID=34638 RepID=A0AAJ7WGL5_9ACAR|nr:latrophilin Cirl [Galendromus occidentalis]